MARLGGRYKQRDGAVRDSFIAAPHDPGGCDYRPGLKAGVELQVSPTSYRMAVKKEDFDVRLLKHRSSLLPVGGLLSADPL